MIRSLGAVSQLPVACRARPSVGLRAYSASTSTDGPSRDLMVVVDAASVPHGSANDLLASAHKLGRVVETRVYGDFSTSGLAGWRQVISAQRLTPQLHLQGMFPNKKAPTYIAMSVDASTALMKKRDFVIVSNDPELSLLAQHLRNEQASVFAVSTKQSALNLAVDRFLLVDHVEDDDAANVADPKAASPPAASQEAKAPPNKPGTPSRAMPPPVPRAPATSSTPRTATPATPVDRGEPVAQGDSADTPELSDEDMELAKKMLVGTGFVPLHQVARHIVGSNPKWSRGGLLNVGQLRMKILADYKDVFDLMSSSKGVTKIRLRNDSALEPDVPQPSSARRKAKASVAINKEDARRRRKRDRQANKRDQKLPAAASAATASPTAAAAPPVAAAKPPPAAATTTPADKPPTLPSAASTKPAVPADGNAASARERTAPKPPPPTTSTPTPTPAQAPTASPPLAQDDAAKADADAGGSGGVSGLIGWLFSGNEDEAKTERKPFGAAARRALRAQREKTQNSSSDA